ncbi:MAG TPA: sarcosine oxidase subunit gamma family protein [Casimicrobiaceae bacterium]|nr:sarcosine oxidase subunit gamma family protein [Casimicrobiaceae bacterium]
MADRDAIAEVPIACAWNVHGDAERPDFLAAVAQQLGVRIRPAPNTTTRTDDRRALWLGPRSWLIVIEPGGAVIDGFEQRRDALNAAGGALFDVTASRVAFRMPVALGRVVLAAGCPLDLDARIFIDGACAQSVFGKIAILVWRDDPTFTVMVARSFARDVAHAMRRVAR